MISFQRIGAYLVLVFSMAFPAMAYAEDFFVITSTHPAQAEAQKHAALHGGWVLDTDFYEKLAPNLFAVVRGPFKKIKEAQVLLSSLKSNGRYSGAYIKDAGNLRLSLPLKDSSLSPLVLAALLGEIRIHVTEEKGGTHPCEPQEPYRLISLSHVTVAREWDEKTEEARMRPVRENLDIGGFWLITRTGAIERMRVCAE